MELLGKVGRRAVYYLGIRKNPDWKASFPSGEWIVFTIANEADRELIYPVAKACIDHKVGAVCCAGELAHFTEQVFDEEIVWRKLDEEIDMPLTTASRNFDEEFWMACREMGPYQTSPVLLCIDMTGKKVRNYLKALIPKINEGWIPSEAEHLAPSYDEDRDT